MTLEQTHYDTLGVVSDASLREIKLAYIKKAFQAHPERNPDNRQQAQKEFERMREAYEILEDHAKRKAYDKSLAQKNIELKSKNILYRTIVKNIIEQVANNDEINNDIENIKKNNITNLFKLFKEKVTDVAIHLAKLGIDLDAKSNMNELIRIEEIISLLNLQPVPKYTWNYIGDLHKEVQQNAIDYIERNLNAQLLEEMAHKPEILQLILTNGARNNGEEPAIKFNEYSYFLADDELRNKLLQNVLSDDFLRLSLFKSMDDIELLHTYGSLSTTLEQDINLRLNLATTGVHAYRLLPRTGKTSVLGWFSKIFDTDRGLIRANVYHNLLQQAKTPLEKTLLIYALLDNRTGGSTLKKYVYKAMGYDSLAEAKASLTNALHEQLPDKQDMLQINKLLYPIIYNANHKKSAADPAYNVDMDKLRSFIATKVPEYKITVTKSIS